jgi:hypothetical protein
MSIHEPDDEILEKYGTNPNTTTGPHTWTNVLVTASKTGNVKLAEQAILNGAEYNDGAAMTCAIIYGGHFDIVRLLVSKGAIVNTRETSFPLVVAAEYGLLDIFKYLLDQGSFITSETMCHAAKGGSLEIVQYICNNVDLEKHTIEPRPGGSSPDDENDDYDSDDESVGGMCSQAIQYAAEYGHLEILNVLMAKINGRISNKYYIDMSLRFAIMRGHLEIVKVLVPKEFNKEKLVKIAVESGNMDILIFLLEKYGTSVVTPKCISIALDLDHTEMYDLLIKIQTKK